MVEKVRAILDSLVLPPNFGRIIAEEAAVYIRDPLVQGIFLFGSCAAGGADAFSDVDLYIVKSGSEDYSTNYCSSFADGIEIQIQWRSPETFREKVFKRTRRKSSVRASVVLFDRTGELSGILAQAKNNAADSPLRLEETEKTLIRAELDLGKHTVNALYEQGRLSEAILITAEIINKGLEGLYDARGWWWLSSKKLVSDLRMKDSALAALVDKALVDPIPKNRLAAFIDFCTAILKEMGGSLDRYDIKFGRN